jgi:hypothetical protein
VRVVTVDVNTLAVKVASHRYTRLDTHRWRFGYGDDTTEFDVDEHGLLLDIPGRFRRLS